MSETYSTATAKPNPVPASPFRKKGRDLPTNSIVMRVARTLWPLKTDLALAEKSGTSERMCRYWLSSKYDISADDLVVLLRGEDGFRFLEALMAGAKPTWWKRFKKSVALSMLRAEQAAQRKRLEQLEMEFDE